MDRIENVCRQTGDLVHAAQDPTVGATEGHQYARPIRSVIEDPGRGRTVDSQWTDLDRQAVDTARALAMDAVQKVGNGHPGTAMSLAPAGIPALPTIFFATTRQIRRGSDATGSCCPAATPASHSTFSSSSAATAELSDLEAFRTWGSKTPGHPEYGHTVGIETTTGPLGQGYATAVGMAMDTRYVRGLFDPVAEVGSSPFDHRVWVFAGDGCVQEGITGEAASLAGHQKLGNLIVIYDDNHISIEGNTEVSFSEDVLARHAAYGWHTQHVDLGVDGDVDVQGLARAMRNAMDETGRPSIISLRTIIAWPAPDAQNTGKSHGSALGAEEIAKTKSLMGMDPDVGLRRGSGRPRARREVTQRGAQAHAQWNELFEVWKAAHPDKVALLDRLLAKEPARRLGAGHAGLRPRQGHGHPQGLGRGDQRHRRGDAGVLGGSADLAESNLTTIEGGGSFLPADSGHPPRRPTDASCTSASASMRWARSSTASRSGA